MIEAIARAIAQSENSLDWHSRLPAARAALNAMLEPTPEMLDAALPTSADWGDLPDDWRAMVQHVIDEQVGKPDAA